MKDGKYFSNCIIEAVKAKLKNWSNVRIIYQPGFLNDLGFHFYWKELDSGLYYDFIYEKGNRWFCKFLFEGRIRCLKHGTYEQFLNSGLSRFTYKLGESMDFLPQQNLYNTEKWRFATEPIEPNDRKSDKIMYAEKEDSGEISIKIVDLNSLTLVRFHTDEKLERMKKRYEEKNEPFDIEYKKRVMAIKEFKDNEKITGWKYIYDIPIERE